MKTIFTLLLMAIVTTMNAQHQENLDSKKTGYKKLTDYEKYVILEKGTERPFTGELYKKHQRTLVLRSYYYGVRCFHHSRQFKINISFFLVQV